MNILVFGGDGFIGSHFVDQAISLGHNVSVFDRFDNGVSKHLERQKNRATFISGEFANREQVSQALKGADIVYHFINITNPATSWNDPFIEIENNLKYSVRLFELAADNKVKKIVFPSSGGAIYGRANGVLNENTLPNPFNPHGVIKLAIEHFLNYYIELTGIAADIYRIGNAYGPRQPMDAPQGVIAVWMGKILANKEVVVYGDNETLRDYVFVEDIARLITRSLNDLDSSDIFNLGSGVGISILQLLEHFKSQIDIPFKSRIDSRRAFDNTSVILDSSKLVSFFPGFQFQSIEEKIKDTWLYLKNRNRPEV